MARIRRNQEYRNKIANKLRVHLEQENTQEKEKYLQSREALKPLQYKTWQLASEIIRRHYTPEDVEMARHLQNKFENARNPLHELSAKNLIEKTTTAPENEREDKRTRQRHAPEDNAEPTR